MKSRYNELMSRVKVTPEMQDRILSKLNKASLPEKKDRKRSFPQSRRFLFAAAASVLLITGSSYLLMDRSPTEDPPVQVVPDIREYSSLQALSASLPFQAKEVKSPPFPVEKTTYLSYWGEMAQITYEGASNQLVFRMAEGHEDVSGIHGDDQERTNIEVGSLTVQLRGLKERYQLAAWTAGGFSYSMQLEQGISEDEMREILLSVE